MIRTISSGSVNDSLGEEVKSRFSSLRKLILPLSRLCLIWTLLTIAAYFVAIFTDILLHQFLLVGSLLSLIAGSFILFAGYMSSATHRKVRCFVYLFHRLVL